MKNTETKKNIELLLPFYVNGTLDDDEKKLVEHALAEDKSLLDELVFLQDMQTQIQMQQENSPGELGLKRLQRMLKKEQADKKAVNQKKHISVEKKRWQFMAMAACLVLVVQTMVYLEPEPDQFTAAGGNGITRHEGKIVSVTFAPNTSELSIRRLLLETNIFIIDGPSALGIYRLSITDNIETTINKLKARTDLIESIQRE